MPFVNEELAKEDCERELEDQTGRLEDDFTTQEGGYDAFASLSREDGVGSFLIGKDEGDDTKADEAYGGDKNCPVILTRQRISQGCFKAML